MGIEVKGTSPILHAKKNINGKQILTENKLKSKNESKNKLRTVRVSKGGKV